MMKMLTVDFMFELVAGFNALVSVLKGRSINIKHSKAIERVNQHDNEDSKTNKQKLKNVSR